MPGLMHPAKSDDVQMILGRLKSPESENSTDKLKSENEQSVEILTKPETDEVDASTAEEAAATTLMSAISAQNPAAIVAAIKDLVELFNLDKDDINKLMRK